jgi:ABC-type dipeptide/oligopeptide/nickel transport system permease component
MKNHIVKRVLLIFFTAFIILSMTFILMKLLPPERPAGFIDQQIAYYDYQVVLGYMRRIIPFFPGAESQADVLITYNNQVYAYYYVPIIDQYFNWLANIVTRWDWGTSTAIELNVSAIEIIARRLPATMRINLIALFIAVPLGFSLGILAALKKNKPTDHVISTGVMIFISVPSFVVITLLIFFFAYGLRWFPSQWPSQASPLITRILGFFIPVMALSFGTVAGFTRFMRAELTEIMSSEFLLLARTKGLTKRQAVIRHALRNSLVPLVPGIIGQFIGILSGSIILENLYGIPGIGNLFLSAITQKDYNVIMVDMAIFTMIGLFATLLVDITYGIVDPRIRMGARK